MLTSHIHQQRWLYSPLYLVAPYKRAAVFWMMDTIITDTTNRLRAAVLAVRAAPQTYCAATEFANDIEAALDGLRRDLERNAPIHTRIARLYFALGDRPAVILQPGDLLQLRREPDNRADANAVAVYAADGTKCGHLPRGVAADLAPVFDTGLDAVALVSSAAGTDVEIELSGPEIAARNTRTGIYDDMPW